MLKLDSERSIDLDNELSEACTNTLDAIIRKCPIEVKSFIPSLFNSAIDLLEYDPNYTYNDDADMNDADGDEGWGSDFDEGQG
jgi:cullin-associated NEDD8-dissociated protein 1